MGLSELAREAHAITLDDNGSRHTIPGAEGAGRPETLATNAPGLGAKTRQPELISVAHRRAPTPVETALPEEHPLERMSMSSHKPGRPAKPASKKRQQLHISLYPEDIERLDQLTDNRSEFLRQCIARSWDEKHDGGVKLSISLPKWLLREVLKTAEQMLPPDKAATFEALVAQIATEE